MRRELPWARRQAMRCQIEGAWQRKVEGQVAVGEMLLRFLAPRWADRTLHTPQRL